MPPAARLTDMHVCPMVTGIVPHVGGPIVAPGEPTVLIGFLPAARATDQAVCVGPPDMIAMGSPTVLIGGLMAARIGDPTEHGGVIILGDFTVMIGEAGSAGGGAGGIGGIVAGLAVAGVHVLQAAAKSVYAVGAAAIDNAAKAVANSAANFLAGNTTVRNWLLEHAPIDKTQTPYDGDVIGAGCKPTAPDTVTTAPGIRPANCSGPDAIIPRVYFANGINTKVVGVGASMCATMQSIANQTCAEVVGVYGATEGMLPDLDQAVNEIAKNSNSAQVKTLNALMNDALQSDPPQDINIIAHSRGGLATQEGLDQTKNSLSNSMPPDQVDATMSHVNVQAYGTAVQGWPTGPQYTKLNNAADPVPSSMQGAQNAFPDATYTDNDATPTQTINEPQLNPISAHSIDDIYTKYMGQAAGPRNCDCSQ